MQISFGHDQGTDTADPFERSWEPRRGAAAGVVATVVMGAAITVTDLETLRVAIAGLYGSSGSLVVGWAAHLVHGTLFGLLFAWLLADPGVGGVTRRLWKTVVAGLVYGLVLAVVGAGIVMPIWLGTVGIGTPPTPPHVTGPMLAWHAVYGSVLGAGFATELQR